LKRNVGITAKWREEQQKSSLLGFETLQKTKNFGEQTAAARDGVTAKTIVSGLFQNLSGRPEDLTVSGPCHLYSAGGRCYRLLVTGR